MKWWRTIPAMVLVAAGMLSPGQFRFPPVTGAQAAGMMSGLHVRGNQIVNGRGKSIRLLGVNRSGTEFGCVQNSGIFDGPVDTASIKAIVAWHVNTVRVPLNEDCWLAINGVDSAYSGTAYHRAVENFVKRLNRQGLMVILDLHWTAAGTTQATKQQPMPDRDHAAAFWRSVAGAFKSNTSVLFDLFNEPFPDNNQDSTVGWKCWRDGGQCAGISFTAAGMQELVRAVRGTGARNIIMLGGLKYANSLRQWLRFKPVDPLNNLAASWHSYNFNACGRSCWATTIAPLARHVPVITGEMGENDCKHGYIDALMRWLDTQHVSYLGWTWNAWDCSSGPALITDYDGTPTNFGVGFRNHLAALARTSGH